MKHRGLLRHYCKIQTEVIEGLGPEEIIVFRVNYFLTLIIYPLNKHVSERLAQRRGILLFERESPGMDVVNVVECGT